MQGCWNWKVRFRQPRLPTLPDTCKTFLCCLLNTSHLYQERLLWLFLKNRCLQVALFTIFRPFLFCLLSKPWCVGQRGREGVRESRTLSPSVSSLCCLSVVLAYGSQSAHATGQAAHSQFSHPCFFYYSARRALYNFYVVKKRLIGVAPSTRLSGGGKFKWGSVPICAWLKPMIISNVNLVDFLVLLLKPFLKAPVNLSLYVFFQHQRA